MAVNKPTDWIQFIGKRVLIKETGQFMSKEVTEAKVIGLSPSGMHICLEVVGFDNTRRQGWKKVEEIEFIEPLE